MLEKIYQISSPIDYFATYERLVALVKTKLAPKRFNHSLGVAATAVELALLHNEDPQVAFVAGICHDIAKELPQEEQKELLDRSELKDNVDILKAKPLWHGPAGCVLMQDLRKDFTEISEAAIDACLWHTVGKPAMTPMQAIIFLADMIEPARTWEGVDQLRELAAESLPKGVLSALETNFDYLKNKNKEIFPGSFAAYDYYKNLLKQ